MARKRLSLYDAHVTYGLRQFGRKVMEDGHIAAEQGARRLVSKLFRRGVAYVLTTERKNGRNLHTVNADSTWCKKGCQHDKVATKEA